MNNNYEKILVTKETQDKKVEFIAYLVEDQKTKFVTYNEEKRFKIHYPKSFYSYKVIKDANECR